MESLSHPTSMGMFSKVLVWLFIHKKARRFRLSKQFFASATVWSNYYARTFLSDFNWISLLSFFNYSILTKGSVFESVSMSRIISSNFNF